MFGIISLLSFCSKKSAHFPVRRLHTNLYFEDMYNIDVTEMHPKTVDTALKHCETYKRYASKSVCAEHTGVAFSRASQFVDDFYKSKGGNIDKKYVILDSGCGAGMSTVCLALLYPDLPVIGIDRSIARLSRNKKIEIRNKRNINDNFDLDSTSSDVISTDRNDDAVGISNNDNDNVNINEESDQSDQSESTITQLKPNAILLRAELSDLFTLISSKSDWIIHSHYLLYPNPYPKSKHLQRRWHGHPIFPVILALGGKLTVRSNWKVYCEEMKESVDAIVKTSIIPGFRCVSNLRTFPLSSGSKSEGDDIIPGVEGSVLRDDNKDLDLNVMSLKKDTKMDNNLLSPDSLKLKAENDVTTHFETKYLAVGLSLYEVSFELGERNVADRLSFLNGIEDKT